MGSYLLPPKGPGAIPRKAMMTVGQLAEALGATIDRPGLSGEQGSPILPAQQAQLELDYALQRLRPIEQVSGFSHADKSSLVFVEEEEQESLAEALACGAGAILLPAALQPLLVAHANTGGPALLLVERPRFEFARAAKLLRPDDPPTRSHPSAYISVGASIGFHAGIGPFAVIEKGAVIGERTTIGASAVIGAGVIVGAHCRIYPRVVIYPGTRLGDRVIVHAGAVLGSDGFGYVRDEATGAYLQFPQQGTLVIEDDVEIGANTAIDRGALGETHIARGAKVDNLVHIGHNVQVGADTVIAAQVGVSGSSTIGKGAVLAGQVGIGDHAAVGDGVILGGQGGVLPHKTLTGSGKLFWGTPARPVKQCLREIASLTRLARRGSAVDKEEE